MTSSHARRRMADNLHHPRVERVDDLLVIADGESRLVLDRREALDVARQMIDELIGSKSWVILPPVGHAGIAL